MPYQQILYSISASVATITLNRPERLNAWTSVMGEEFRHAIRAATSDAVVRAIVITGSGKGFCPGVDVRQLEDAASRKVAKPAPASLDDEEIDVSHSFNYLLRTPKPVIAGINGGAAGIGFCLSLCCDLRYMAAGAKITTAFARRGLVAEYASAWLLPRLIGTMNAMDLLLSGRTVNAEEADRLGLVRLIPAENFARQVQDTAAVIANNCSPRSLAVIKRQVLDGYSQTLSEATRSSAMETFLSHASEDFKEGIAHYVERRSPVFTGR
jgi:enoyl-CoA hydratase/carnithine racemase